MKNIINKFIFWLPRILALLFVGFLMVFSLDVFDGGLSFWKTAFALFMHNIPALILLAVVLISWKYEIVGGVAFVLAGLLYVLSLLMRPFEWHELLWSGLIAGPAILVGMLFLTSWFVNKKSYERRKQ